MYSTSEDYNVFNTQDERCRDDLILGWHIIGFYDNVPLFALLFYKHQNFHESTARVKITMFSARKMKDAETI